ncbi:MAG: AAA family ATPase [Desulfuromonadales bacterium]|nr:AAA family ATPase [Desulfuromonadales bacterium]
MYLKFFGLKTKPFELVPNPAFLYPSRGHQGVLDHLEYGFQARAGFILLTGEIGSGKTTLVREMLRRIGPQTDLAIIFNTRVTTGQLLAMINEEFGLPCTGRDKIALLHDLNNYLIGRCQAGRQPILIIDEAQNLTPQLLEEVRLLSNLEGDDFKLLQIVLVGQPELRRKIALPELRQLQQRIAIRCHLRPLGREEMEEYILHRLECAGNRQAVSFGEGTLDVLFRHSRGVPRLVNTFCDFLLLAAFAESTRDLTLALVEEVIGEAAEGSWAEPAKAPAEPPAAKPELEKLAQRLDTHEKVLKKLMRHQEGAASRQADQIDRLATLLETLPERLAAALHKGGKEEEGDPPKGEKVVRLKC